MRVEMDGDRIASEADVHRQLAALLDFGPYYGKNLDALWDRLTTDVPRPVHLVWTAAAASRAAMGAFAFERVDRVLRQVAERDAHREPADRFTYELGGPQPA
ncbi:barstar family protein [Paractinoplanes abujensis]|uniref:Ribonuclease inhibitor n=1 Tax=Paractinoplanes abujensis TaxID=882441 RepID=A0A7W7CPF6_9ACTN|nr:barstar family protein [Actinoplanes abujensis]MBB4692296.1 ribonuclease inhibitor [Actinoplanes abujensis]